MWCFCFRVALWNGLLRHCNQACKMFSNGYTSEPNAKEPILDFFGVSVKAEDVPQQVERMYLLKKKVSMAEQFYISVSVSHPVSPSIAFSAALAVSQLDHLSTHSYHHLLYEKGSGSIP